ncbi:Sys1p KNAG_0M01700 [Huiozyma naganishii CBS 8797]|uniref:Protein SYS1 n=1 Tax=Huiozyma naganishii (strain ATCC MYA-139 / BCRC 22969 / CBS 8797 / KCTC 17520 / NBRC 10181 / NCYC 3082 / Yp74L-3) TaxID=1071383 RepID=J7RSY1_HUIN7|nr:hypothetical protein KNAG_0M01700 [Kazachstania naganishii CBS 8797]CCK73023.1 hypothetical protein KNAG_0M01700 [Kazachstania naganishii CBS 8797]
MVSLRRYLRAPKSLKPSEIFKQDSLSPGKITVQIVILQLFYYATAIVLFYIWAKLVGHKLVMLDWLFSSKYIDFTNGYGLSVSIIWLLDSLICVIFLTVIVGRSKLAWDFGVTVHAINFIILLLYTKHLPSMSWVVLQILSSLVLIFLGTWTSRWRELKDTFFEGMVEATDISTGMGNLESSTSEAGIEMKDLESQR